MTRRAAAATLPAPQPPAFQGTSKRERILRAVIAAIHVPSTLMAVASQNRRNSPPPGPTSARMSDLEVGELTGAASYRPPRRGSLSDFGRAAVTTVASLERSLANIRRPEERIRIAIRHHLETLGRDRALAVVSQVELRHSLKFMSLLSQQEVADYLNILRKIVEYGQNEGVFRRDHHPQLVAKALFGILDEMVTSWILSEKDHNLAEQADPIADLVLAGLL